MLKLIIAEAALELVPQKIASHPVIQQDAQRRKKASFSMLLDSSKHYKAMHNLEQGEQRGRPDLVHDLIKLCLDSSLNKAGQLELIVQTRDGKIITINPETRIPRSFVQFCGLMEQLYEQREIKTPEGKILLKMENAPMKIEDNTILMDAKGSFTKLSAFVKRFKKEKDSMIILGGFPHGAFHNLALQELEKVSLAKEELTASAVLSKILTCYEMSIE